MICWSKVSKRVGLLYNNDFDQLPSQRRPLSCPQDEQKAEDELAKKRAAFLLKQQKKAEEARLRKFQLEAESELKRDEAR